MAGQPDTSGRAGLRPSCVQMVRRTLARSGAGMPGSLRLTLVLCVTACTAAPGHRLITAPAEYVYLPAPCIQVCELQLAGRLAGACSQREQRRFKALGMSCMVADPLRHRRALLPADAGSVR